MLFHQRNPGVGKARSGKDSCLGECDADVAKD